MASFLFADEFLQENCSREPAAVTMSDPNAELIKELLLKANGLCKIASMFNEKLAPCVEESEEGQEEIAVKRADFKSVLDLLESFPTVFQLLNNHINTTEDKHKNELAGYKQREVEWEKLSDLFTTYKKKLTGNLALQELTICRGSYSL